MVKQLKKYFILIFIIFLSIYFTSLIKEQFPSIKISSREHKFNLEDATGRINGTNFYPDAVEKSELHDYCSDKYGNSIVSETKYALDDSSIRVGDPINVYSIIKSEGESDNPFQLFEFYVGTTKDSLNKIIKSKQKIELIYHSDKSITTYLLMCFNLDEMNEWSGKTIYTSEFERPSFVDSLIGNIIIFLTSFVLIGSFLDIVNKIIK